jgi:hypothetical protein
MNKIFYFTLLLTLASHVASTQGVETYSSLEIGYDVSTELPADVVLGINGHVYIQDGNYDSGTPDDYSPSGGTAGRTIKAEYADDFLLWVERGIVSEDLAIADRSIWLADYVFDSEYELPTLEEMESYVQENKHLPDVIGQDELDDQGYYRINEMLIGQLKNIEELLLHTLAQEKKIQAQAEYNKALTELVTSLEERLLKLE